MTFTLGIYGDQQVFDYHLLPLEDLGNSNTFRINNLTDETLRNTDNASLRAYTHLQYPFTDFLTLQSHVWPYFVVFNTSSKLALLSSKAVSESQIKHGSIILGNLRVRRVWNTMTPPSNRKYYLVAEDANQFGYRVRKASKPSRRPQTPLPDRPKEIFNAI